MNRNQNYDRNGGRANERKRSFDGDESKVVKSYKRRSDSRDRENMSENGDSYYSAGNDRKMGAYSDGRNAEIDEGVDKEWKELFVGNILAEGISNVELQDFLNGAMRQVGLVGPSESPIIFCRMSSKYSFIHFRSVDDCTKGLNLNGIPFYGSMLKIGRPAKYNGPLTTSMTWQQISGQRVPEDASNFVSAQPSDPNTKQYREIFVGNTEAFMSELDLHDFIGGALRKLGMSNSGTENPVVQVRVNGKFSFLEMRTAEDAANVINLNGAPFMDAHLKLCRPAKYDGGNMVSFYRWNDIYSMWSSGDLALLTSGAPSKVVMMSNVASAEQLADSTLYLDIIEDTRAECSLHGAVRSVIVPRSSAAGGNAADYVGRVFVEMATVDQAKEVVLAMKGRTFDERPVDVRFYPEQVFANMNYGHSPPTQIITKSHGPVTIERVLDDFALKKIWNSQARQQQGGGH